MFLAQNKMAEGGTRTESGDSVDVSCFSSQIGPSCLHVKLCHCPDLVSTCIFVRLTGIYNIINKGT